MVQVCGSAKKNHFANETVRACMRGFFFLVLECVCGGGYEEGLKVRRHAFRFRREG